MFACFDSASEFFSNCVLFNTYYNSVEEKMKLGKNIYMLLSATFLVLIFSIPDDPFQFEPNSTNFFTLLGSKKKTKIKSFSRCFLMKVWDSKSSQVDFSHFICWKKNEKRLHNWDSKQGASKP